MYIDWESVMLKGAIGLLICAIIALIVGAPVMIKNDRKAKNEFMADCLADNRKQYECTAMWRAGKTNAAVMPIPAIIR